MTKTEICKMCEEYSSDTKCEYEESCKIIAVLKENKSLKKENRELKSKISELENKMSYMVNPLSLGDRNNQMGW